MGLADVLSAEDRVEIKFSDFYTLVREAAKYEIAANGIKTKVPHEEMLKMLSGKNLETPEGEE